VRVAWTRDGESGRFAMTPEEGSDFEIDADLVLLAMGFVHPEHAGLLDDLGVDYDARGNVKADDMMMTSAAGVFAAGDMHTGASLVARCIAQGRRMARRADLYLMGETSLPETELPPAW
jgi:glutamate synthase (NADPH) small chain